MYGELPSAHVHRLPPEQALGRHVFRIFIPMPDICPTDDCRCVDDRHVVTSDQFLAAMVGLLAVGEVRGSVEPEDAEVDVRRCVGADLEDASDPEAGAVVGRV